MAQPGFWDDVDAASTVARRRHRVEDVLGMLHRAELALDDARLVIDLWDDADALALFESLSQSLAVSLNTLLAHTRCQDDWGDDAVWVLLRGDVASRWLAGIYTRFAQRMGWACQWIEGQPVVGYGNQVSLLIQGQCAYAYFIEEVGLHRLARFGEHAVAEVRVVRPRDVMPLPEQEVEVRHMHTRAPNCSGARCGVRLIHQPSGVSVMWMGLLMSRRPTTLGELLCAKVAAQHISCDVIRREVAAEHWLEHWGDGLWALPEQWARLAWDGQLDDVRHRQWWRALLGGDCGEMDLNEIR